MAKPVREKTPAEVAHEAAKEHVKELREKYDAIPEEKREQQNAKKLAEQLAEARAEVAKHAAVVAAERFANVAGTRVSNALTAIRNLTNCSNPRNYSYTEAAVNKFTADIKDAVKAMEAAFRAGLAGPAEKGKTGGKTKYSFE